MRTNKRKLMSLLLTFVMLLSLLPTTALADGETHPKGVNITIGSDAINIDSGQCLTKNEAKAENVKAYTAEMSYVARYDKTSGTLYLKGYNGGKITATNGSLSIVLENENTVTVTGSAGSTIHGIEGNNVDLTIEGSGSLTVNATGTGNGDCYGIYGKTVAVAGSANVTVNATNKVATYAIYAQNGVSTTGSSALNLTVTGAEGNVQGLYGIYVKEGNISLGGSGTKSITMKGVGDVVYGIYTKTSGNTTVSGGKLTIKNETSYNDPSAISAKGVVTLNAPVTIENFKFGVYNNSTALSGSDKADIKITGGTISITSTKTDSDGLHSMNKRVAVSGGTVNISTKGSAIFAKNGGLDVTDAPTVTLNTEADNAFYNQSASTSTINLASGGSVTATSKGTGLVYPIQGAITLGGNTKVVKGEQYTDGTVSGAETAAGSGTYTVQFAYEAPGAASATVENVTIEGTTNEAITGTDVTVTLTNDKFKAIAADTDVTSWFTNLPTGLTAKIKTAVSDNATTATITVSGTPTANSTAALAITIPADQLVTSTSDLTVTTNASAKFAILTLITEATATVTAPVAGQTPSYTATSGDSTKYTATVTKWMTSSGTVLTSTDTFSEGVRYAVEVEFEPTAGYKFAEGCTYKINGSDAINGPTQAYVYLTASAAPEANISLKLAGTADGTTNYTFENETPLTVTITNSGTADTGALTIALDGEGKDGFTVSSASIANVEKSGGTANFTVTPKTGLTAGDYTAKVKVSGTGVTEQSFTVNYTASGTPAANISLDKSGTVDFGSAEVGYSPAPTALTVTITNNGTAATGELTIALSGTNASSFELNKTSISDITVSGTDTFTVQPKTGLDAGSYTATIKVSGSSVTEQSFTVKFTVTAAPISIAIPTAITGLIYDGTEQIGVNEGTGYTLSGTYKATDVGTTDYTAAATLDSGYKWNDGTTDAKTITWNIGKRTPTAADFTFTPPSDPEYDSSEKTASITLESPLTKAGAITPTYMKDGAGVSDTKDVGDYTVKIDVAAGDNFNAASGLTNDTWKFSITPATWGVPTEDLTVVNPTSVGGSDGKITGTTSAMQYKKSTGSSWTDCTGDVTGLTAGTYHVRYKADSNHNASDTNYKTVTLADPGTARYSVTVTDGTASPSGDQAAGAEVTITAATKTGFNFKEWSGLEDSVYKPGSSKTSNPATFTMPASAVSVTATYEAAALTGTASITGTLKYGEELTATLTGSNNTGNLDYKWYQNGTTQIAANNTGKYTLTADDIGKTITVKISSSVQTGEITSAATGTVDKADGPAAPTAFTLAFTLNADGTTYTATIPTVAGGEYSFDGTTYSAVNTKADCTANTSYTGYVRIAATSTHKASAATSSTQTSPKLTVATPTFTPNGASSFTGTQSVTISCATADAKIYYTTDGTTPTTSSTLYTTALSLTSTTTVKAIAVKDGMNNSAVATATFTKYSGGGGGGGGSYTPSYTVSVDKTENGTITVSPKSASKGDTVTITVKPDKGYELDALKVLDKNGDKVKLTEKNGKYTFTMPAGKVTVKGSFAEEAPEQIFADVPVDAYYYEAVKWAAEKGITGGIGNDLFAPNQPCTRAQIVTFLWRAAGSPEPKAMSSFADVTAGSYYAKAVAWAVENGITSGTGDGKFSPDATCTRAQAVTFLYRASGAPAVSGNAAFSDVATNAYYASAVRWAEKNGITGGIGGGLFGSDNDCTRAQIVTFLYRNYQSK